MRCRNGNSRQTRTLKGSATWALLFILSLLTVDLHAESNHSAGSRQAVLHISVVVMPVIQALKIAPSQPQIGAVTYNFDSTPRETRYEVRAFPQGTAHGDKQTPAILKTLIVVPK